MSVEFFSLHVGVRAELTAAGRFGNHQPFSIEGWFYDVIRMVMEKAVKETNFMFYACSSCIDPESTFRSPEAGTALLERLRN